MSNGAGGQDDDDPFFPAHRGRPADQGAPDLRLFTGGLTDYARLAKQPGDRLEEEDDGAEQRLAERFASKPPQPVYIPERPLVQAIIPYIAAAGFFVFAGTGSAIYFFKSEPSLNWGGYTSATAATVTAPKIDAALTAFVPKSVQEPAVEHEAPAAADVQNTSPSAPLPSWTDTVESFKTLAGPKLASVPSKGENASAAPLLKAVEAWGKSVR